MGGVYILGARILFAALILCYALRWLARDEADYSFQKCALVVAPVLVAPIILTLLFVQHLPPAAALALAIVVSLALAVYLVHRFCWIALPKAIAAVAILAVGHALVGYGIVLLRDQVHKPVRRVAASPEQPAAAPPATTAPAPVSDAVRLLKDVP